MPIACVCVCVCVCVLFVITWYSPTGSSGHEFPRQEYWSGLSFPPAGDLPDPGIKPMPLASRTGRRQYSLPLHHWGSPVPAVCSPPKLQFPSITYSWPPLPISLSPTSLSLFSYPPSVPWICVFVLVWFCLFTYFLTIPHRSEIRR